MKYKKEIERLLEIRKGEVEEYKSEYDKIKNSLPPEEWAIFKSEYDPIVLKQSKDLRKSMQDTLNLAKEIIIKEELKEVEDLLNFSFISKKYFNKSRNWLSQKINGSIKNGKPAKFTEQELKTFECALKDISKITGSINFF